MKWEKIFLLISTSFLIIGLTLFFIGFHNVDNAWNMVRLECLFDIELVDETLSGMILDESEIYKLGFKLMYSGLMCFIFSFLFLFFGSF